MPASTRRFDGTAVRQCSTSDGGISLVGPDEPSLPQSALGAFKRDPAFVLLLLGQPHLSLTADRCARTAAPTCPRPGEEFNTPVADNELLDFYATRVPQYERLAVRERRSPEVRAKVVGLLGRVLRSMPPRTT